jgi:hypothetical protein
MHMLAYNVYKDGSISSISENKASMQSKWRQLPKAKVSPCDSMMYTTASCVYTVNAAATTAARCTSRRPMSTVYATAAQGKLSP